MNPHHKKYIKYSVIAALVLLVLLFLSRGLIRKHLVPAYVELSAKKEVDQRFKEEFNWINTSLEKLNLNRTKVLAPNHCNYLFFEGIRSTVDCFEVKQITTAYTPEFAATWSQYADDFEKSVLDAGWKRVSSLPDIKDSFTNAPRYGTFYEKNVGDIKCDLTLGLDNPDVKKVTVTESCNKYVRVLGGAY